MEPYVKHYQKGSCGILEFGNPEGNSLSSSILNKLYKKIDLLDKNQDVRVIILQSHGSRAFCGGASFTEMKNLKNLKQASEFFMCLALIINRIRSLSKFVVARVQGKVVGGGVGLVAACDYVLAHESAEIKLSELSIGLGPFVIEPVVSRKIGTTAFAQLSIESTNWKNAQWAADNGLYAKIIKSEKALNKSVFEMGQKLADYHPKAIKNLRKLHWKDTGHWRMLLPKNANITAKLLLEKPTQKILESLVKK